MAALWLNPDDDDRKAPDELKNSPAAVPGVEQGLDTVSFMQAQSARDHGQLDLAVWLPSSSRLGPFAATGVALPS